MILYFIVFLSLEHLTMTWCVQTFCATIRCFLFRIVTKTSTLQKVLHSFIIIDHYQVSHYRSFTMIRDKRFTMARGASARPCYVQRGFQDQCAVKVLILIGIVGF